MAHGDGARAAHQVRLGGGGGCSAGEPLCKLREDYAGAGQPQHAHAGSVIRRFRAGAGAAAEEAHQVPVHPEARELAERGGVRVELSDAAVSEGSTDWGPR